jgi:predicted protein tyrosine phosphatase
MFIDCIQRHIAVCGFNDLAGFAKSDRNFWNVISILEPSYPKIAVRGFLKIHHMRCYDVIGKDGLEDDELGIPKPEHLREAFRFSDAVALEPLLVHCRAGISRSTGMAMAIIVRAMFFDGFSEKEIFEQAPDILLGIRPQASPNPMFLELGFREFLPEETAITWTQRFVKHPTFLANRYTGSTAR